MIHYSRILLLLGWSLGVFIWFSGCASPSKSVSKNPMSPKQDYTSKLIREAKAESDQLRSQLATERIQAAKHQAEIQTTRREISKIRERETEFTQKMQQTKSELSSAKAEVDRLRKENAELQGKTAGLPQLLQVITEIRNMQSSLTGMVSTFKDLSTEMASVKKDIRKHQRRTGWNPEVITVQKGDTLWALSRTYGTTVKDLQTINNIDGSLILPGQELRLLKPGQKTSNTALSKTPKNPRKDSDSPGSLSPTATSKKSP